MPKEVFQWLEPVGRIPQSIVRKLLREFDQRRIFFEFPIPTCFFGDPSSVDRHFDLWKYQGELQMADLAFRLMEFPYYG